MQQLKPLTLRRNFSWTFTGNLVYAASQWGMLVVLAKLGRPEMLGQFTLGLAVTAPVFMLTNLQLRSIQATDAKHEYLFGDYLGLRLIGIFLGILIVAGIAIAAGYRWETSLVILTLALAKGFESISDVFYGLIQNHERMDRIAISLMIKGPLSLVMLGIGVYSTRTVLGGVVGLTVAWAFLLFTFDVRSGALLLKSPPLLEGENLPELALQSSVVIKNPLQPRWDWKTLVKLIWLALPLGLVMMLISLNTNIPRYFIERYLGERELGIFGAISYLMVAGTMVISSLGHSASPRLAKYYAAGDSAAFRKLLFKLVQFGFGLGGAVVLVAMVVGRQLLALIYRPEYAEQADILVWLMIAAGIGYGCSFLSSALTAARCFRIQLPLFTLVTGASATTGLWLIPAYGLRGAAFALIIASVVQLFLSLGIIFYVLHQISRYSKTES
ncbi:MATE family efflux transporter [Microcoleus sp. Pol10D4]|uniref:MATE family efflux transporter n=1 Tax=Microcoleus sp. Pol10D4 TaxID=3055387 RepID=UPI002FD4BE39